MSERQIETREYFGKWSAHCGCGSWWSGLKDTEAEAVEWIETQVAEGLCQCVPAREGKP